MQPGQLVVVPSRPALGVGRLERLLRADDQGPDEEPRLARVFFYDEGRFEVLERALVAPAPPGVWPRGESG